MEKMQTGEPAMTTAKPPFPSLVLSSAWVVAYLPIQQLFIGILAALVTFAFEGAERAQILAANNGAIIFGGLIAAAFLQIWLMWLYLRSDDRTNKIGLNHYSQLSISHTFLVAFGALILAATFNFLYANVVLSDQPMQDQMNKLLDSIPKTPFNIALILLAITLVAPIFEELLFRGLLQNALLRYLPAWGAITLSAFSFSVIHLQPVAIPALMALGAAFGYIYHKTGSLRITIILHMANNVLALVMTQFVH